MAVAFGWNLSRAVALPSVYSFLYGPKAGRCPNERAYPRGRRETLPLRQIKVDPNRAAARDWLMHRDGGRICVGCLEQFDGLATVVTFARYFYSAAHAHWIEDEVDRAAKFVGDKAANRADAIARLLRCDNSGAAGLNPFNQQAFLRVAVALAPPAHRDVAALRRQRAILQCVRDQLVQRDRNGLRCFREEQYVGSFHARAACSHARR